MKAVQLNLSIVGIGERDAIVELSDAQAEAFIEAGHAIAVDEGDDEKAAPRKAAGRKAE